MMDWLKNEHHKYRAPNVVGQGPRRRAPNQDITNIEPLFVGGWAPRSRSLKKNNTRWILLENGHHKYQAPNVGA